MTALDYPFRGRAPASEATFTVSPGVRWRQVPLKGPLRHINCWMLGDGADVSIVDTGFQDEAARAGWRAALAGERVTRVICTHHHPDHSGLAGWLCREHHAPLVMTDAEWRSLSRFAEAHSATEDIVRYWRMAGWNEAQIAQSLRGWGQFSALFSPPPESFQRIANDDRLRLGNAEWRVVVGNGHSPEHACLLDERSGVLISGDQVLPGISPNISLLPSEPESDPLGEWLASIERLRLLDADLLVLPSHGDPFRGLHARLDAMAEEHHRQLDKLHLLLTRPHRVVDCFPALFRRAIGPGTIEMATGETLAHLRRLEIEGRVAREMRDGVYWFAVT
ncbi:MAG TPA: MBL fold metallo-hydrolase [Sphingomonas sp.]|nr:MBL fold metallo-hydrolase [Sphingomonas sp.]